jgi:hypothetical protein
MSQKDSPGTNAPANQRSEKDKSDFVRPSLTMTERHLNLLDEWANEAYAGNRSACIRAAIEDHANSLEGENEFSVKKLESAVEDLEKQFVERMDSFVEGSSEDTHDDRSNAPSEGQNRSSGIQHRIYRTIPEQDSISLDEILSQSEQPLGAVGNALESLCKQGLVNKIPEPDGVKFEVDKPGVGIDE